MLVELVCVHPSYSKRKMRLASSEKSIKAETADLQSVSLPLYLSKRPGGADRLRNIVQIGATCITLNPWGPNILLLGELDLGLSKAYNEPQTPTDLEDKELYNTDREHINDRRGLV
jgi:hypothetical protein